MSVSACGGGGGGGGGSGGGGGEDQGTDNSAAEAAALVSAAKGELETLITNTADGVQVDPNLPIPYADMVGISIKFNTAADLDPTNDEAAFFGAIANLLIFLDSDTSDAFLARLGWPPFDIDGTVDDFLAAYSASVSPPTTDECDSEPTLPGCQTGFFGLPAGDFDYTGDDLLEVGGTNADVTVEALLAYLTVALPDALQRSVILLDGISSDFQTTLTLTLPESASTAAHLYVALTGSTQFVEIDYSDAKLLQTALAAMRTVLIAPRLVTYTDVDAFLESHPTWDDELKEVSLDQMAFESYFKNGWDGDPNSGDEPLLGSPAGTAAFKASIDMALKAAGQFMTAIVSETDDQSDDLIPQSLLLDGLSETPATFDDKQAVVLFFLQPMLATINELRTSITTGSAPINVYQTVAHIRDWNTCVAVANGEPEDTSVHNEIPTGLPGSTLEDIVWNSLFPGALSSSFSGTGGTPIASSSLTPDNDGAYYVWFQVSERVNISIYTRGSGDTGLQLGYVSGTTIVPWDSDEDSGEGDNAGISIDLDYLDGKILPLPDTRSLLTFYVRIDDANSDGFDLFVETAADDGSDDVPIFLKGGGGRTFDVTVHRLATVTASLGGLIDVIGNVGTVLQRDSFSLGDEASETPPVVKFRNSDLRNFVKWVFPEVTDSWFEEDGHPLSDPAEVTDLVGLESFPIPAGFDMPDEPDDATDLFSGTKTFCAYPYELSPAFSFEAGFSLIGL